MSFSDVEYLQPGQVAVGFGNVIAHADRSELDPAAEVRVVEQAPESLLEEQVVVRRTDDGLWTVDGETYRYVCYDPCHGDPCRN